MIFTWLDEEKTPNFRRKDRMIGILFDLGITSKEQLLTVTDWTQNQITGTINKIRQSVPERERDSWIRFWAPGESRKFVYSLGEKGIQHACAMIHQEVGRRKPLEGQIAHFLGINEILCRLIRAGTRPKLWYSTKEASSYVYHHLTERELIFDNDEQRFTELKLKTPKFKIHPDAMVATDRGTFFVEYDTGSENGHKIEDKFHKYAHLRVLLGTIPPVLWVTVTEQRKNQLIRVWRRAQEKYPTGYRFPEMHIFAAGEETAFLQGVDGVESKTEIILDRFDAASARVEELTEENRRLKKEAADAKEEAGTAARKLESEKDGRKRAQDQADHWRERYLELKQEQAEAAEWFQGFVKHLNEDTSGLKKAFRAGFRWAFQSYIKRNPLPQSLEEAEKEEEQLFGTPWGGRG